MHGHDFVVIMVSAATWGCFYDHCVLHRRVVAGSKPGNWDAIQVLTHQIRLHNQQRGSLAINTSGALQ